MMFTRPVIFLTLVSSNMLPLCHNSLNALLGWQVDISRLLLGYSIPANSIASQTTL
jgi:hypothetical protein